VTAELSHSSATMSVHSRPFTEDSNLGLFRDALDVRTELAPAPFRFIDLFAGIGGIRLGLEQSGGTCVYSVEIDPHARRTYEANFGPCEAADVREVDPADLPSYDVLAAGFPCQPFSLAGVSKKLSLGRAHGFKDATSGNLFFEITRIAEATERSPPSSSLRMSRTYGRTTAAKRSM
jgi:hypothetical protein